MIPSKKNNTKYPFNSIKPSEFFIAGEYTQKRMRQIGSHIAYYNRTRKNKHFVQRMVYDGDKRIIRVYREK